MRWRKSRRRVGVRYGNGHYAKVLHGDDRGLTSYDFVYAALQLGSASNWATFDIVGDLVFGQEFGCLERAEYRPWITFIMGTLKVVVTFTSLNYVGARWWVRFLFRTVGQRSIMTLRRLTDELVSKRLAIEKGRDDLFEVF
ncbi:e791f6fe-aa60-41b4-a0de-15238a9f11c0 [Thermothielavioides terrestris]|uniref:E791f6fe-aa60-41b4-a0de-15238a9f11c0 n=1 Tax=Thermothielavioides terrestris TaxID=2587410 RepID=A0A3S4BF58_9PEZI|nr:e791f6fe-aa60-41b4-a0de-15238a9f11c0 [Thermothielavioides terrestris]